jgi:cation diffusion facilitator family transporter
MAQVTDAGATRRGVLASLGAGSIETLMLAAAAVVTGSVALRSQVAASAADVAVQVFLLIGVFSSSRPSDDTHPLGYGRERFFWSYLAALGIFVGGGGFALEGAVSSALHPSFPDHFAIAYLVLALTVALDALSVEVELRPLRAEAARRRISLRRLLVRSTDPAATTVVVGGGCGVIGGIVSAAGLALSQASGSAAPDTVASLLIGLLLLGASAFLLSTNRDLLSGRGVPLKMLREMREVVAAQPGVVDVPDLFAVVVGPSSVIVNGDVTFEDDLDVPTVEQTIMRASAQLGERWPAIDYVYLTPVPYARVPRGGPWYRPESRSET